MASVVAKQERAIAEILKEKGSYLRTQTVEAIKRRGEGCRVREKQLRRVMRAVGGEAGKESRFEEWVKEEALHC